MTIMTIRVPGPARRLRRPGRPGPLRGDVLGWRRTHDEHEEADEVVPESPARNDSRVLRALTSQERGG